MNARPEEIQSITKAIKHCRHSGHSGWRQVEFAQQLVATKMQYSYTNSFDLPAQAFAKGRGYCWHQAGALLLILRGLGVNARLVYATRNLVPATFRSGRLVRQHVSGHVWCRVIVDGEERDVCPGNINNRPGCLHFQPLSEVREWNALVCFFSYLGSAFVNARRHRELSSLPRTGE